MVNSGSHTVGIFAGAELAFAAALALIAADLFSAHLVRRGRVTVAAARLHRGRGKLRVAHSVHARAELTLAATLALLAPDFVAAHFVLFDALAVAAALLLRGGPRRGGRHLAVLGVVRHQELAAHRLTARAIRRPRALIVGLVAIAAVAAANRLRSRRGGRPHRLAVLVLAERLEIATRLAIFVGQHQTLLLGAEGLAALHPALAVRNVGVAIAAPGLRRRLGRRKHAVLVENAERDERARRTAVALSRVLDGVARVVRGAARAFAAARCRCRGGRLGGGDDAV